MTSKTHLDPKPFNKNVRLVMLDLDCFLYPYDKTYRTAVLRAWKEIENEYGLPIFRRRMAQKLIEEAKQEAKKNPDDPLYRYISELAGRMESKALPGASVIGMLEAYYRSRKAGRSGDAEQDTERDSATDPPYKEMIAMAFNLRLLRDHKGDKKARLTRQELQEKILEGDQGITRLWHKHMGTGFLRPDARLASKIQRLKDAGVEVAILTHSCKQGEGEALEKLERLGLKGVIPEQNIFGLEEISPYRKGKHPEVFEKTLAAINDMRDPAKPIRPSEAIMAEDTIGNLRGAKKAGMQTVWVPRSRKGLRGRVSPKVQKRLASVDHIYATPHQFLDALHAAIRPTPEKL